VASVIQPLQNEPISEMEKALSNASKGLVPIEINGEVYYIHTAVQDLIDSIYIQTQRKEHRKKK